MLDLERQKEYDEFMAEPKQKLSMHVYLLPNLMTTGNLFFGFYAIILSMKQNFEYAAYAIVAAAIFDLLDGRLARLTRSTSKFGAEYDSLCDLISFCMAPALIMYLWALQPLGRLGWISAFLFLTCGALRLARFNVQSNVIEKAYFQGLPTPMAAGIVASSILAFNAMGWESQGSWLLLGMTVLLAAFMISNFRYRSFKDLDLKQRLPFHYLVLGVLLIAIVAFRPEVHLFILFMLYAILGAVYGLMGWGKRRFKRNVYLPKPNQDDSDLIADVSTADEE